MQAQRAKEVQDSRTGALFLREFSAGTYLSTIVKPAFGDVVPPAAMQIYRTGFLAESKVSGDPIETALTEEFILVHHTACKLLGMSCDLANATVISEIGGVAARFLAEARKLALALKDLKQKPKRATKGKAKPKHQSQGTEAENMPSTTNNTKKKSGARLTSNGPVNKGEEMPNGKPSIAKTQPSSRCGRAAKSNPAGYVNGRRPGASAAKRPRSQALDALNRTTIGRR